jgi:hypothetical protein
VEKPLSKEREIMTDRQTNHIEAPAKEAAHQTDATARLQEQALVLHQCKDGSLVRNPLDCKASSGSLPSLHIDGEEKVASKTFRRSPGGVTSDGGKVAVT